MPSPTRLPGLAILLLLLFLAAALVAQRWLQRQHARLQAETMAVKRSQFLAATAITGGPAAAWTPGRLDAVGRLIDAKVTVQTQSAATAVPANGDISVTVELPPIAGAPAQTAILRFRLPAAARLSLLHGRTWVMLLVLALTMVLLFTTFGLLGIRRSGGGDSRPPWSSARADMRSLEQLARTSVAQGDALAQERGNRQRAEQDLSLNQHRLNQALEEKIRLGRDLHDGVIQALYAAGLTIEAALALIERDPVQADQHLRQCLDNLNGTIHDVRDYITGLSPEKLRRMNFAAAVEAQLQELRAGREVKLELVVDEDAASTLTPEQSTEALQVSREAISNGLRHGGATAFTIRLHRSDDEIGLLVRDDGCGFGENPHARRGHGLNNMQARAQKVGATLRIDSQPGEGTRMVMTFPVNSPA